MIKAVKNVLDNFLEMELPLDLTHYKKYNRSKDVRRRKNNGKYVQRNGKA